MLKRANTSNEPDLSGPFARSAAANPVVAWITDRTGSTAGIINYINIIREQSPQEADRLLELILRDNIRLDEKIHTDNLTGVYSRAFLEEIDRRRTQKESYVLMLDLNKFKWANDTYGHAVGDGILQHAAFTLATACQRPEDCVIRLGGDEFLIFLPNTDKAGVTNVVKRIQTLFHEKPAILPDGTEFQIQASFGRSRYGSHEPIEESIKRADQRMYRDKSRRKYHEALPQSSSGDVLTRNRPQLVQGPKYEF